MMQNLFLSHWPAFIIAIIGVLIFCYSLATIVVARKTENWSTVLGMVEYSEVSKSVEMLDENSGASTTYEYSIVYSYKVGNDIFKSDKIHPGLAISTSSKDRAMRLKEKYKPFTEVLVYYNPANPKESVLEKGVNRGTTFLLVLSILTIISAIIIYLNFSYES